MIILGSFNADRRLFLSVLDGSRIFWLGPDIDVRIAFFQRTLPHFLLVLISLK